MGEKIAGKDGVDLEKIERYFETYKKNTLGKLSKEDRSKKGCVDKDIRGLIDKINSFDDFYTTSSCSGRIMLIDKSSGRKDMAEWLLSSHDPIKPKDFKDVFDEDYLASEKFSKSYIWFKQEPAILHVCCRNLDAAKRLLEIVRAVPFKRSGIIAFSKRIVVEVLDTEKMETLVAKHGRLLVDDDYAKILVDEANSKLKKTKSKLKKLEKDFKML